MQTILKDFGYERTMDEGNGPWAGLNSMREPVTPAWRRSAWSHANVCRIAFRYGDLPLFMGAHEWIGELALIQIFISSWRVPVLAARAYPFA